MRQPTAKKQKVFVNSRMRKSRFTEDDNEDEEEENNQPTPALSSN